MSDKIKFSERVREDLILLNVEGETREDIFKQVAELFTRFRVWDYIYSCFEALHTTGVNYIVEDIDLYIEARQPSMA